MRQLMRIISLFYALLLHQYGTEADRQKAGLTDRPTDRQTDRQTERKKDRQVGRQAGRQADRQTDRQKQTTRVKEPRARTDEQQKPTSQPDRQKK